MIKVFIAGDEIVKKELAAVLQGKVEISGNLTLATDAIFECSNMPLEKKGRNLAFFDDRCSAAIPVFTSSVCHTVSEQSKYTKYPSRLVGIGLYSTFSAAKLLEIAPSKITDENIVQNAISVLKNLGFETAKVPDRTGLVFPRILAMIINEAAQVYSEQIASKEDIDTAMKLGTNYPMGPLEWADKLGIDLVYEILAALQRDFGEDRYRPHPVLKEMVNLRHLGVKAKKGFYDYS
jgi:3-hydroxybutyryl-CoA dehydrogenase